MPISVWSRKLVVVPMTSLLLIISGMEDNSWPLERVPCIYYVLRLQKDLRGIRLLIDLGSEVNIMTLAYGVKLDFEI